MTVLAVTRSLVSGTNPTEAQFDTIRSELLTFFNTTLLTTGNLSSTDLTYAALSAAADDASLKFTSSEALIKFISATPTFQIENTLGSIIFTNTISSTEATSLTLASTGTLTIGSGGLLNIGQGQGSVAVTLMYMLARYRKPRLEYTSADIVTVENNTGTASETVLLLRDRLTVVVDRTMSLAATANGYDAAHTGAAVSGIRDGLARANNTWYYVYGVQVQYGDDNSGAKSILVADTTSPVRSNASTLDTRFGSGKWIYLGVIRNGFNDGVTANSIVPFVYDGFGTLRFYGLTATELGMGITLASATASSSDLTYTLAIGTGAAELPVVATRAVFQGYRSGYGFEMDYESTVTGEVQARATTYDDSGTTAGLVGSILMPVPIVTNYRVVIRVGADSTNQRIKLVSITDHYA